MERVFGVRLFDLIRMLREIEIRRRDGLATLATRAVITRARERLRTTQAILLENRAELATTAYPIGTKLDGLFSFAVFDV